MAFILQKWLAEKSLTVSSQTSKSPNFISTVFCHFLSHSLAIFLSLCHTDFFLFHYRPVNYISLSVAPSLNYIFFHLSFLLSSSFSCLISFFLPLSLSLILSLTPNHFRHSLPLSATVVAYLLYFLSLYPSHFESISFYCSLSHIPFSSFNFRPPFLHVFQHLCPLYLSHFPLSLPMYIFISLSLHPALPFSLSLHFSFQLYLSFSPFTLSIYSPSLLYFLSMSFLSLFDDSFSFLLSLTISFLYIYLLPLLLPWLSAFLFLSTIFFFPALLSAIFSISPALTLIKGSFSINKSEINLFHESRAKVLRVIKIVQRS